MLKQTIIIAVIALFSLVAAFEAKSIISMATTQNISFSNDSYFLGGQPPSYYLNINTAFSSEISGTYNTIDVLDDTLKLNCANVTGATSNLCTLIDTDTKINSTDISPSKIYGNSSGSGSFIRIENSGNITIKLSKT